MWYNYYCLDEQTTGRFAFSNAVTNHNIFIVGKAPFMCGLTSRCSSRQRRQAHEGRFLMSEPRILVWRYRSRWPELIRIYGKFCVYCEFNYATSVDHVMPISYKRDDSIENLRPACVDCNLIASNKVFDDFEAKKWYILEQRKKKRWQRKQAVCTDCKLPYIYLGQSPSLFLCPECYDIEYVTELSKTDNWLQWLALLVKANLDIEEAASRRVEIKCERDKKQANLYPKKRKRRKPYRA